MEILEFKAASSVIFHLLFAVYFRFNGFNFQGYNNIAKAVLEINFFCG